jgi:cobalt-zinc-cadmium efflux system membrane fusion protein
LKTMNSLRRIGRILLQGDNALATRGAILLVCGAGAIASLAGCSGKTQIPQSAATPRNVTLTREQQQSIHSVTIEPSQYRTTITTTGVVDFNHDRSTDVLAPFSGPVTAVLVTLGERVAKDQPLAKVDSPDFAAAVGAYRKALINAKAAEAIAANDRDLYARHAISERENAQAQAEAVGADADRDAALQALVALHMAPETIAAIRAGKQVAHGQGVIRAPIAGTVVQKSIAAGQTLAAGTTTCFTIANTSRMWVMANVFGGDIAKVRTGDPATVDLGDDSRPIHGRVTNVAAVVNPNTRSVEARVLVDNPRGVLKQQMSVTVHIQSRKNRTGLLVPVSAVLRNLENLPFVYVAEPNGGYARRPVSLGPRVGDDFVVRDGLRPGDRAVVDGSIFLNFIQSQ